MQMFFWVITGSVRVYLLPTQTPRVTCARSIALQHGTCVCVCAEGERESEEVEREGVILPVEIMLLISQWALKV